MGKLQNRIFYDFDLHKLGHDFMGYEFYDKKELTYHHIQPKSFGGKTTYENGALLIRPSHNYIHTIETTDFKIFLEITQVLRDEHQAKQITREHLQEIYKLLEFFEHKYEYQYTKKGVPIIKEDFIRRRVKL